MIEGDPRTRYESRIVAVLDEIKAHLAKAYSVEGPDHYSDEGGDTWILVVQVGPDQYDLVDVNLSIMNSQASDGTDDGVAFAFTIVTYGGTILGELIPGNYTDRVWIPIDDHDALEERFRIFEQLDVGAITRLIKNGEWG